MPLCNQSYAQNEYNYTLKEELLRALARSNKENALDSRQVIRRLKIVAVTFEKERGKVLSQ